jgi:GGDEF domain-containing protein
MAGGSGGQAGATRRRELALSIRARLLMLALIAILPLVIAVKAQMLTGSAAFGILIAIVLMGIWCGGEKLFVEPIGSLTRMAQRLANGEFGARANELPCTGEFMPLAAALEDMAGRIAGRGQELRASNLELRQLAYADALTGIPNRRAFNAQLAADWDLARALAQPIAVLVIDVDYFKRFNDRYGHVQGDHCLKRISEVLIGATRTHADTWALPPSFRKYAARASDFTARYGGEEFAVLLQRADLETAYKVAERLREGIEKLNITHESSPRGRITISVGAASAVPAAGESAQELLKRADDALYEAKRRGRNTVVANGHALWAEAS